MGLEKMVMSASDAGVKRVPLSRDRVLRGALAVADSGGLGSLTIRSLAHELGVKPMSVYHYVANKDEIVDGIVDLVFSEIDLPTTGGDWRTEIRRRATSARAVLRRHSWAIGLMESRTSPGPATLRHHDAVIATLRSAGFSHELTAHAYALLDARAAVLDDAVFERPGLFARQLEIHVSEVHRVPQHLTEHAIEARVVEPARAQDELASNA